MATTNCVNGRVKIPLEVERRLFASAGGHCQKCRDPVFVDLGTRSVNVGEMAHIIGATDGGPRGKSDLSLKQRAEFENLILLCPTCHRIVDKAPKDFPGELLQSWKDSHERGIRELFGVMPRETRAELRLAIGRLLDENRAIWERYGPESAGASDPLSEKVHVWRRKIIERILPNNRRLLLTLDVNRNLLDDDERKVVEHFRQHADDLVARHVHGVIEAESLRFPPEMESILR